MYKWKKMNLNLPSYINMSSKRILVLTMKSKVIKFYREQSSWPWNRQRLVRMQKALPVRIKV